jgi:hypothetical protein
MKITGKELRSIIRETVMQEMGHERPRGMMTLRGGSAHNNPSSGRGEAYGTIRPAPELGDDDAVDDIRAQFMKLHGVEGLEIYRDVDGTLYGSYVKPHMRYKVYPRYNDN